MSIENAPRKATHSAEYQGETYYFYKSREVFEVFCDGEWLVEPKMDLYTNLQKLDVWNSSPNWDIAADGTAKMFAQDFQNGNVYFLKHDDNGMLLRWNPNIRAWDNPVNRDYFILGAKK